MAKQENGRSVRIDWKAYYLQFRERHGRHGIKVRGREVFPDGWSYSATSYLGPEYPPPSDPRLLAELMLDYWDERRKVAKAMLWNAQTEADAMEEMFRVKTPPIPTVVTFCDRSLGKKVQEHGEIGIPDLEMKRRRQEQFAEDVRMCRDEMEKCRERLKELGVANVPS